MLVNLMVLVDLFQSPSIVDGDKSSNLYPYSWSMWPHDTSAHAQSNH